MELSQLRYFTAVAQLENISKAAETLFVSQSNISTSLSRLEQELEVPLFDRRKGKVVLNQNGELFLRYTTRILSLLEEGVAAVHSEYHDSHRPLSLACMVDDSRLLTAFLMAHPKVNFNHQRADLATISSLLSRQEADLALTVLPPSGDQLAFEVLYQCDFVLVLNRDHPLAEEQRVSYEDLKGLRVIIDTSRVEPARFAHNMREHGIDLEVDSYVQDSDLLLSLIEANRCVTHLPAVTYRELMLRGKYPSVTCVPLPPDNPRAYWGIAWNKRRPLNQDAQCLRDFVRDYFTSVDRRYLQQMEKENSQTP